MDWGNQQTTICSNNTRSSVSIHGNVQRTWFTKPHDYRESDRGHQRNRHNKHFLSVRRIRNAVLGTFVGYGMLCPSYVAAETVGGVSATAAPVANSSGSVTNQAIQVLQGPYITNTYGGGIQCQGVNCKLHTFHHW